MKEGLIQNAQGAQAVKKGNPTMQQYIKQMEGEIAKALPSVITPERFTRITLSALSANKQLAQTTPQSFLGAMMTAAQLGMEPNTPLGQAYLIPYRNHGQLECQFQLGYKGLIDLAYRSGEVSIIQAQVVYENDEFEYSFGLEPKLNHKPASGERGEPKFIYAMFRTKDGGFGYDVMSVEDVRNHAKRFPRHTAMARGKRTSRRWQRRLCSSACLSMRRSRATLFARWRRTRPSKRRSVRTCIP